MTTDKRWLREKTQNPEMCSQCKGECCKQCGCAYFPSDLDMSKENLEKLFKKNLIVIDQKKYYGSAYSVLKDPIYFLRVPNHGESIVAIDQLGECIFLTETGCSLSYDERPSTGRFLIPHWSGCYYPFEPREFIELWAPYQDLLKSFLK